MVSFTRINLYPSNVYVNQVILFQYHLIICIGTNRLYWIQEYPSTTILCPSLTVCLYVFPLRHTVFSMSNLTTLTFGLFVVLNDRLVAFDLSPFLLKRECLKFPVYQFDWGTKTWRSEGLDTLLFKDDKILWVKHNETTSTRYFAYFIRNKNVSSLFRKSFYNPLEPLLFRNSDNIIMSHTFQQMVPPVLLIRVGI